MLYLLALSLLLSSSIHGDRLIFSQDHDDLSLITRQDLLENVLQTDGALAVTNLGVNCARALQSLKKNAPSCLGELENSLRIKFQDYGNVGLSITLQSLLNFLTLEIEIGYGPGPELDNIFKLFSYM